MKKDINITICGKNRIVTIIKKKKKNISLFVKPTLEIILNIPFKISYEYAIIIIKKKEEWINEKLNKYEEIENFEGKYLWGIQYTIKEINSKVEEFNKKFNKNLTLEEWYYHQLEEVLSDRLSKYSKLMGVTAKKVRIKYLKSAWGINYSSGTLTFNLNLVKLPIEFVDYLVVHELGHFKYPNHSKEYWSYIENFIPNPKRYRKWLRQSAYKFI